jgi:hypothetical protein
VATLVILLFAETSYDFHLFPFLFCSYQQRRRTFRDFLFRAECITAGTHLALLRRRLSFFFFFIVLSADLSEALLVPQGKANPCSRQIGMGSKGSVSPCTGKWKTLRVGGVTRHRAAVRVKKKKRGDFFLKSQGLCSAAG